MDDLGHMQVDWEQRIDMDRMRRERLAKAKKALADSDLGALLVLRHEDMRYLTGWRSHQGPVAYFGVGAAVLPRNSDPILYVMDIEWANARMPWLSKEQVQPRPNLRELKGAREWAERVKAAIGDMNGKKIGVDIWTPIIGEALTTVFPHAQFVDGYGTLLKAKSQKTADEVACAKAATVITEAGFDAAVRFLRPGVRECEVLAVAWQTMTALGSEWTQCANIVCSGPYTAPYRRFTSDRIIRNGDLVIIDIGGCFNGYWGDMTRTWVCGNMRPTEEQKKLHQICYDATWAACAAARPGNTNFDIMRAGAPYIVGHGAGISPWEPPYLSKDSEEIVLQPGMLFSIEPYTGEPGIGGFKLENNVFVTEGDPDVYSTYPFDERLLDDVHPMDPTTGRTRG